MHTLGCIRGCLSVLCAEPLPFEWSLQEKVDAREENKAHHAVQEDVQLVQILDALQVLNLQQGEGTQLSEVRAPVMFRAAQLGACTDTVHRQCLDIAVQSCRPVPQATIMTIRHAVCACMQLHVTAGVSVKQRTWPPQIWKMAVSLAYRAKLCWQNWMAALVASSTRATLNRKLLISVAPGFMGCTVKTSRLSPTLVHPLMVHTAQNKEP